MSGQKMTGKSAAQKTAKAPQAKKPNGAPTGNKATNPQVSGRNGSHQKAVSKSQGKPGTQKGEKKKSVGSPVAVEKTKERSPEEKAAIIIQGAFRQYLARKQMKKRKKDRQEYQELMDRLQKEVKERLITAQAFVAMVKREQEEAERQRQKDEEERRKKIEEQRRKKRILEAAFDGDVDEILAVLKEVSDLDTKNGIGYDERGKAVRLRNQLNMVDCTDANGNTPLSEAASGGHPEAIKLLIERGAQLNTQGVFGRTPLYRAAFGAHIAAVEMLLQYGADPRIYAEDGSRPDQVASMDAVVNILRTWDTGLTDSMLKKMEAEHQRRKQEEQKMKNEDTNRIRDEVKQLTKEHERCQKELQQAYAELNRRITEHDKSVRKHMDKTEITLQAVHDAEFTVESLRVAAVKAEERLAAARLRLRERMQDDTASGLPGLKCSIQELDEVLMKDVGNKIQQDGRWPLIVDPTGQAATFLRYRDTNYLDTLNPAHMQAETIRLALLGALRYGKPLVFDMMEVDMFNAVKRQLDYIQAGLSEELFSKKLLQNERYLSLVKSEDGLQYSRTRFQAARTENFKLFIITKLHQPPEPLLSLLLPIEVVVSKKGL
ncbi:IQ motif and ankyrin repeat domain-containing protein 1 isoform X1 [Pleurodeles waltl]|uniref:IQ motif and ankyrin repeat domain-containing protein 1 isoform X1 n=1 Tax=Pleurodeles waltl TaxID=8319 RepID=UPI003709504E